MNRQLKRIIKFLAIGVGIVLVTLFFMIEFSPYKKYDDFDYKLIKVSVNINAKPSEVFNYLGNSSNAEEWSTFVNHITPLNPNEKEDGEKGSVRRCFKNKDKSGEIWDEEILIVKKNKYRKLSCYNFKNFSMSVNDLRTEQLFETLKNGETKLSFTLFFGSENTSFIDELKMYYAAYEIASIFEQNLLNIKYFIEKDD